MLPFLLAGATILFSGVMPPHLANDGQVYLLTADASVSADAERAALRACQVSDYKLVQGGYEFGLGPADAEALPCLTRAPIAGERVVKAQSWS